MLSADFSSTVYVTTDQKSVWRRFHKYLSFMCKFVGVGNILHIARKCLAGNKSAALMCKALKCTLNSTTVPKHFMKFFQWCNFHLYIPFSSCKLSFLIIVFTQHILASTVNTSVGFGKTIQVSC